MQAPAGLDSYTVVLSFCQSESVMVIKLHLLSCAAVLRRLLREQEQGTLPEPPMPDTSTPQDKAAEMLAVATSHPTWMVKRWLQRWGQQETMTLLAHNNRSTPPPPQPRPPPPRGLLFYNA